MPNVKYIIHDLKIDSISLDSLLEANTAVLNDCCRVMVHSADPLPIILTLELAERLGFSLYLCHAFFDRSDVLTYARRYNVDTLVTGINSGRLHTERITGPVTDNQPSYLHIFTTGTTGEPKLARHSWQSIAYAARHVSRRLRGKAWLMAYSFTGYAGLQVFYAAQRNDGAICFAGTRDFARIGRSIVDHDVKVISATPTFWRMLINAWPRELPPPTLEQATLGGEVITQDIIDLIDRFFRPVGLAHIYASTEAGSVISVPDRRAGFPATYLEANREIGLRIREGILEIRSPACMEGYVGLQAGFNEEGWINTGDRVEERAGRIYFKGRNDSRINIGGIKVLPEEIESVINQLPEVEDCVVYSKRNPIMGAILSVDLQLHPLVSTDARQIKLKLQELLPQVKIPQYIRFVDAIEVSENGKKLRT